MNGEAEANIASESKTVAFPPMLWALVERFAHAFNLNVSSFVRRLFVSWLRQFVAVVVEDVDNGTTELFTVDGSPWPTDVEPGRTIRLDDEARSRLMRELAKFGG